APGAAFSVQVALDGNPMRLLLSPHSMRSPDFQLLVQVESGAIVSQEPAPITTYRGEVEGVPGSVVAASLIDGQLTALIRLAPDLPVFGVQPASASVPGAAGSDSSCRLRSRTARSWRRAERSAPDRVSWAVAAEAMSSRQDRERTSIEELRGR
ncbi:MAG TPA: hypothetical protein VFF36_15995, partial [Planctomycetota bacterium]|nr:hypothetical protein [Planctomycetota bacterium]